MNDARQRFVASATRLFGGWDRSGEQNGWDADLWKDLERANLTLVSVPTKFGGAGGTLGDAAAVLRLAGRYAMPVPLAEMDSLAGWVLWSSGLPVPNGPLTIAPVTTGERIDFRRARGGWILSGRARRVPAARMAARLVIIGNVAGEVVVATVNTGACEISPGENLAGEARDDIMLDSVRLSEAEVTPAGRGVDEEALRLRGALVRSVMMAGALEHVLELSVSYAKERHQFGRPIGKFQAVQQQLATLAGEAAAAGAVVEAAVVAAELGGTLADAAFEIAAAKVRVGEAVGTAAAIAHQVHGAIGFTERHPLRHSTRRLWAWRDEFGAESEWASRLGDIIARGGPEALWPTLTNSSPTE